MTAPFRVLRVLALFAAFLAVGAGICSVKTYRVDRTLYYDVEIDGRQVEVRVEQYFTVQVEDNFSRTGPQQTSRIYLDKQVISVRDPTTGEYRPATSVEIAAILSQIYIPEFTYQIAVFPARGPTDGIGPKPGPSPPPSPPLDGPPEIIDD